MNVCEHGDHEAPEGKRFCSTACLRCQEADVPEGEDCAGICQGQPEPCGCVAYVSPDCSADHRPAWIRHAMKWKEKP